MSDKSFILRLSIIQITNLQPFSGFNQYLCNYKYVCNNKYVYNYENVVFTKK